MAFASSRPLDCMAAIGTESPYSTIRFASCRLYFVTRLTDIVAYSILGLDGLALNLLRLVANSFLCMRERNECKNK